MNFQGALSRRISYVGTFGRHNQAVIEGNPETQAGHDACLATPACSGTLTTTGLRNQQSRNYPTHTLYGYPNSTGLNDFASMGFISSIATSNYNSLQLSLDKGLTHGLQVQASYTFSHALDDASSFEGSGFGGTNGRGYNQFLPRLNYGNSTFDYRNRFVIAPIYVSSLQDERRHLLPDEPAAVGLAGLRYRHLRNRLPVRHLLLWYIELFVVLVKFDLLRLPGYSEPDRSPHQGQSAPDERQLRRRQQQHRHLLSNLHLRS